MGARAEGCAGLLDGMRREAARVTETLSGFKDTLSIFHIIGVLTRIETAHLGSAGADFGNLADDLKSLAGDIQAKIESSLDAAAQLISPIQNALDRVSAIEEGQAKDLPEVIAGVVANLKAFRDMQDRTRDASVRLASQYGAVSEAFNKLIVSVQFHDITRQQVEHVIEALRRLVPASGGAGGGISSGHGDPLAVLALQSMQLADAGEKFAASVASVAHNLDRIAEHVLEMAGESRTLSGLSEDAKDSFFLEMERACTTILAGLGGRTDAEAAAQAASGAMAESIGRMHASIGEIRIIEIQIQWMALNASIRSAHIGAAGDALGVIAGSMQKLAFESKQRSESLVQALGSMSDAAGRLAGPGGPAPGIGHRASGDCSEKMRAAVADLHSSSERSFSQVAQIAARSEGLREDLFAARNSFSAGALFAEAIGRARSMLQEIGGAEHSGAPPDGAGRWERGLADLAKHYTMQAERDVHEGVTKAAPAALAEEPGFPSGDVSELGDNIELF
jgi:methyl-accepting chemotaxis protein